MNMFYPTVSMLYHNRGDMLESARKIVSASKDGVVAEQSTSCYTTDIIS